MKKTAVLFYLMLVVLNAQGQTMDIPYLLQKVEKEITDLTVIWDLKRSDSFKILEDAADNILEASLYYLQSEDLSIHHKMILLFAIQNADFSNYKIFLNRLALLYIDRKIIEFIMDLAIEPYDWNYSVRENYRDPEIRRALNTCLLFQEISIEFKNDLKEILSGKVWRDHQRRMRENF